MLHEFLEINRIELVDRCRAKVALRSAPRATPREMEHGIPLFLGQLIETLLLEQGRQPPPGGGEPRDLPRELSATASRHGRELQEHGFRVDQVVHAYGDLCQAVTELAAETGAAVSAEEFHTLNRCLDNAIADAVTEFDRRRDRSISDKGDLAMTQRLGSLAHEMRNFLNTATLAFAAIKSGHVAPAGATSAVMDRSLDGLRDLVDRALVDVRLVAGLQPQLEEFAVCDFIEDLQVGASLEAQARACILTIECSPADLSIRGDRQMLLSAVMNLLQNAFKFTRPGSYVRLQARGAGNRARIDVQDQCGGLPTGKVDEMFQPFKQHGADRSGLGLGLSIARRAVEASGGVLTVRDMPTVGCVFTIDVPRVAPRALASPEPPLATPA